jgi:hypothetical protein
MSRQYPGHIDVEFFTDWAEHKIIQMIKKDRVMNFLNVAELTRSVAFYLNTMEMAYAPSETWLRRRISDTYYYLSDMRLRENGSEEFNQAENRLIETLKFISEYFEENGYINPRTNESVEILSVSDATVFRPPARWLANHSEEYDD